MGSSQSSTNNVPTGPIRDTIKDTNGNVISIVFKCEKDGDGDEVFWSYPSFMLQTMGCSDIIMRDNYCCLWVSCDIWTKEIINKYLRAGLAIAKTYKYYTKECRYIYWYFEYNADKNKEAALGSEYLLFFNSKTIRDKIQGEIERLNEEARIRAFNARLEPEEKNTSDIGQNVKEEGQV